MAKAEASNSEQPTKRDLQADATRTRIYRAVIDILDSDGYAATSLNMVQRRAGVSRGALTHHYPSRQLLIAETAMRLLEAAMSPLEKRSRDEGSGAIRSCRQLLKDRWSNVVDTKEGRAFVEILVASRTDLDLHEELQHKLHEWDRRSSESISRIYRGSRPENDDAALVWSICRSFLRGLLIHRQFIGYPGY